MRSFGFIVLIFEIFSSSGASYSGAQSEIFSGKGDFLELGHFDKHFVKQSRKKGTVGKNFSVFYPRYSSNYILNEKLNPRKGTIRAFFPKIRALFLIFKKGHGRPTPFPPSYAPDVTRVRFCRSLYAVPCSSLLFIHTIRWKYYYISNSGYVCSFYRPCDYCYDDCFHQSKEIHLSAYLLIYLLIPYIKRCCKTLGVNFSKTRKFLKFCEGTFLVMIFVKTHKDR